MTTLSLHHLTMIHAHPLDLIEAAAAGGFSHCGIRLVAPRPGDPLVDVMNEAGAIAAIGRRLDDTGIKLLDIEAIWLSAETRVDDLAPALEAGARLGARYVLVVGNDADPTRLRDNFGALCALAAPLGMTLTLEFITYSKVQDLAAAAALIETVGKPNARLLIDMLQYFRSGAAPMDVRRYDAALFPYVQICDGPLKAPETLDERRQEARENRLLPGKGELPIHELLTALPLGIPLSLEAPTAALRGLDTLTQGKVAGAALRDFLSAKQIVRGVS